jgi:predicted permease
MNIMRAVWFRLRALFDRPALESELDLEMRDHVERQTRANVARGLAPDEARRAALVAFGGVQQYKEATRDARGTRWIEDALQDLRYAVRSLGRAPAFCVAVIFTLGAGIGVNAAMFGILDRVVLSPPSGVRDPAGVNHLYFARTRQGPEVVFENGNYPQLVAFREALRPFGAAAQYYSQSVPVDRGENGWIAEGEIVTSNYFDLLRATPRLGRFFTDDDERPSAGDPGLVISFATWRTRFGAREDVLGQRAWIQGHLYPIVGVAPAGFTGAELRRVDLWLPVSGGAFGLGNPLFITDRWSFRSKSIVRLRDGVDRSAAMLAVARAETEMLSEDQRDSSVYRAALMPLAGVRSMDMKLSPASRVAAWLFAVAVIVSVIACANVANLFLLRALSRRREIAIRRALGVSRARLAASFIGESSLLAVGGCAAALVVVWLGAPPLRAMLVPRVDWTGSPVDFRVLGVGLACAIACALVAGILPLLAVNRVDVSDVLKSAGPGLSARRLPMQRVLLTVQSGLSLLLLVGAGLFVKSLANARAIRLGFDGERVLFVTMAFPPGEDTTAAAQLLELARARLRALPGVGGVARSQGSPFLSARAGSVFVAGDPPPKQGSPIWTYVHDATPDYFSTVGMRIERGRAFTESEAESNSNVAVVSAAIAKLKWPGKDPIGECFWGSPADFGKPCTRVVGVVEDAHQFKLVGDSMMLFFRPLRRTSSAGHLLLVRTDGGAEWMIETVRRTVQGISPSLPSPKVETMQSRVEPLLWQWKLGAWMFPMFGALALVVASIGMYSILAYSTAQRVRELAVRSALGADARRLIVLVLASEAKTVVAGLALGLVSALIAGRFLKDLLLDTSSTDPATIIGAAAMLAIAAGVASIIPAWRAARANPVEALRSE